MYLSDVGLFTTMLFDSEPKTGENIYSKLLGDKLPADLGYLYENMVAQEENLLFKPVWMLPFILEKV